MIKIEELLMSIQKYLNKFWQALNGKDKKELDEALIQQGESDEEKKIIAEVCAEIDLEHDLMEELVTSKKDPGQWLEEKIEETVKEVKPDATQEEEVEMVKESLADSMETEIGIEADGLTEEATIITASIESEDIKKEE
jgi:hypothetical protein